MFSKNTIFFILLTSMLAGCATTHYPSDMKVKPTDSNADIGVRYLLGRGVAQNNDQAFYYFLKAANEGDPFAQNEVAYLYAAGKGTSQNFNKAFVYYQKAANQNLASAQFNLGLFYLHGLGTAENKTQGLEWIKKSAAHGFGPAKEMLRNEPNTTDN